MGCRKADGLREPGEGDGRAVRRRAVQRAPESVASRATPRRATGPASRIKDNFSPRTRRARSEAYLLPRSRVKAHSTSPGTLRRRVPPAGESRPGRFADERFEAGVGPAAHVPRVATATMGR